MTKLTPAAARDARPGDILYDHEIQGLQLHCRMASKSWKLYYRTRAGVERRPTIGRYPEFPLARARTLAQDLKERVARGEDPSGEWHALRDAPAVSDLCSRYLEEWAPRHKAARSIGDDRQRINAYVLPGLGHKKVAEVTRADIDTLLQAIHDRKFKAQRENKRHADKTEAPGMANQVRILLSTMFKLAQEDFGMDDRQRNPVKGSLHYTVRKRKRAASSQELIAMFAAFEKLEETHPREAVCLWTLLFTGARVSEVADATGDELRGGYLVKDKHKTFRSTGEARLIAIPKIALQILERLPETTLEGGRLFPHIRQIENQWYRIRKEIGCEDLQLRDFRRTFASYGASMGKTLNEIGQQLGHAFESTTRGYSWIFEDAKARTANDIADHMMRVGKKA